MCNVCQITVYFVDNQLLVQYLFFTLFVAMYSIAIPMTYLVNERRVKDTIMDDGWIEGIRSVFHSTETIRQLEIKKRLNLLGCREQLELQNTRSRNPRTTLITMENKRNEENRHTTELTELTELTNVQLTMPIDKNQPANTVQTNVQNLDYSNTFSADPTMEHDNNLREVRNVVVEENSITGHSIKTHPDIPTNPSANQNQLVVVDIETHTDDDTIVEQGNEERQAQAKVSEVRCILPQKSLFNKAADIKLTFLEDQNFKTFARRYILRKILTMLCDDTDEENYCVYTNHLSALEKIFQEKNYYSDLIIALRNVWHLSQYNITGDNNDQKDAKCRNSPNSLQSTFIDLYSIKGKIKMERIHTINSLLSFVSTDTDYFHHLQKLGNVKRISVRNNILQC